MTRRANKDFNATPPPRSAARRATIADVARAAGTSTAVVSYVLNPGSRPVSEELRERVLRAIEKLDYRPDPHARALRLQRGWGQIGLVVPDVTLPLYGTLVSQLEREGRARQQLVITGSTGFDPAIEAELVNALLDSHVNGLLAASVSDASGICRLSEQARTPLVWVHNTPSREGYPLVGSDHVVAGHVAAEHLFIAHDRMSVAFVGGFNKRDAPTGDWEAVRDRHAGYVAVYGRRSTQIPTDLTLDGAYRAVREHLARKQAVDGLIVGTYGQSSAVLRAVTDAGLSVPEEVAVITFDGDLRNSYAPTVLTSVQQQVEVIASRALDLLLRDAASGQFEPVPVFLNIGESCGCQLKGFGAATHDLPAESPRRTQIGNGA